MKVLAIDTATATGGVALVEDERVLYEARERMSMAHAERIMVLIDQCFKETGISPDEIEGLAVSIGPGSFTGLRVGLNTAKGLSGGQELMAAPVSTLEVLAGNFTGPGTLCCPMLDARKGEVYTALFRTGEDGCPIRLAADGIFEPGVFVGKIAAEFKDPVVFSGDGAAKYFPGFQNLLPGRAFLSSEKESEPSPAVLARLGIRRLRAGEGVDVYHLEPVYLQRSGAEVNIEKAAGRKGLGTPVRSGKES